MSDVWFNIVMVVVFVLIGGFFSGTELALISLRESQVRALSEQGRRGAALSPLLADPNRFLATVQIGVTLADAVGVRLRRRDAEPAVHRGAGALGGQPRPRRTAGLHRRDRGGQLPVAGRSAS